MSCPFSVHCLAHRCHSLARVRERRGLDDGGCDEYGVYDDGRRCERVSEFVVRVEEGGSEACERDDGYGEDGNLDPLYRGVSRCVDGSSEFFGFANCKASAFGDQGHGHETHEPPLVLFHPRDSLIGVGVRENGVHVHDDDRDVDGYE